MIKYLEPYLALEDQPPFKKPFKIILYFGLNVYLKENFCRSKSRDLILILFQTVICKVFRFLKDVISDKISLKGGLTIFFFLKIPDFGLHIHDFVLIHWKFGLCSFDSVKTVKKHQKSVVKINHVCCFIHCKVCVYLVKLYETINKIWFAFYINCYRLSIQKIH